MIWLRLGLFTSEGCDICTNISTQHGVCCGRVCVSSDDLIGRLMWCVCLLGERSGEEDVV